MFLVFDHYVWRCAWHITRRGTNDNAWIKTFLLPMIFFWKCFSYPFISCKHLLILGVVALQGVVDSGTIYCSLSLFVNLSFLLLFPLNPDLISFYTVSLASLTLYFPMLCMSVLLLFTFFQIHAIEHSTEIGKMRAMCQVRDYNKYNLHRRNRNSICPVMNLKW